MTRKECPKKKNFTKFQKIPCEKTANAKWKLRNKKNTCHNFDKVVADARTRLK